MGHDNRDDPRHDATLQELYTRAAHSLAVDASSIPFGALS